MANSKVQLADGTVLMDLTGDTVSPETLVQGATAHDAAGNAITGTSMNIESFFALSGAEQKTAIYTNGQGTWTTSWKALGSAFTYRVREGTTYVNRAVKRAFGYIQMSTSSEADTFFTLTKMEEEQQISLGSSTYAYARLHDTGTGLELQVKRSKSGSVSCIAIFIVIYERT